MSDVLHFRLDAVQDILDHPTFESSFTDVAKGVPDLERIVSRIHAKSCRVRDFLKVLKVNPSPLLLLCILNLDISLRLLRNWVKGYPPLLMRPKISRAKRFLGC